MCFLQQGHSTNRDDEPLVESVVPIRCVLLTLLLETCALLCRFVVGMFAETRCEGGTTLAVQAGVESLPSGPGVGLVGSLGERDACGGGGSR